MASVHSILALERVIPSATRRAEAMVADRFQGRKQNKAGSPLCFGHCEDTGGTANV